MTQEEFNALCIKDLREAKVEGRVAVVGSGPSAPYIAPIEELSHQLCDRCGIDQQPKEHFWSLAERAHAGNPIEYFKVIRETYDKTPHWQSRVYKHIARLPVQGWATFNYDDQLPEACFEVPGKLAQNDFSVFPAFGNDTYASPQEFFGSRQKLIALHGYCNEKNPEWEKQIILRTSDYNKHYIDNPASLSIWWREMLLAAPCIFLGTSLKEPGLHRAIEYLKTEHLDRLIAMNHIHLLDNQPDPNTKKYSTPSTSLLVIKQIHYDRIDDRYSGLLRILSEFSGLSNDRPMPGCVGPEPIRPTDSFPLYPL